MSSLVVVYTNTSRFSLIATSASTGRMSTSRLPELLEAGRVILRCVLRVLVLVAHDASVAATRVKRMSFCISEYWMRKHNGCDIRATRAPNMISTTRC